MSKVAIILQAGPEPREPRADVPQPRVLKRAARKDHDVRLIFDGASTEWLAKWGDPEDDDDRRMGGFLETLKSAGLVYAVCDFCAGAFGVRDKLKTQNEPLLAEYMNHPSIADLLSDGYQLVTL
jgi:hypothetical protein